MSRITASVVAAILLAWSASARAAAPLETETARIAPRGTFESELSIEVQASKDGHEFASPVALEYSLTNRMTILAEPVPLTRIRPSNGAGATGVGDLEVTLTGLFLTETPARPAVALAGEVKFPTGESPTIGSGRADFTAYGIASKRFGRLDVHANLGFTVVGHPAGVSVSNTINYAVAGEYSIAPRWDVLGEVLGNTSALTEASSSTESAVTPEISGGETIGMAGARLRIAQALKVYLGVAVDNTGAVLFRPGLSARFE